MSLQITDRRERAWVAAADLVLRPLSWLPRRAATARPARVLLLRLERIGDLLMTLEAIRDARAAWPDARIDLAVGSWNAPLAALVSEVTTVHIADVPWLAREGTGLTWPALVGRARHWAAGKYDLVVNFEPDIRSNFLAWLAGGRRRFGYWTGGGGAFLTTADAYRPTTHAAENARRLIARAATATGTVVPDALPRPKVVLSADARADADARLAGRTGPFIGVHASGGRESKQWHLDRFGAVAHALATRHAATIVLTGSEADRPLVDAVKQGLGDVPVVDACGTLTLPELAALLARLDLLVTGDTGPMHLAAAVGTPLVALFGPSDPRRYGPRGTAAHVIRIDLPCSPCGQVRLPPERCRGHVPDCLDGIPVERVVSAASEMLDAGRTSDSRVDAGQGHD